MSKISLNNLSHSYLAQQNNDLDWAQRDIDLEWSDGGAPPSDHSKSISLSAQSRSLFCCAR